MSVKPVLSGLAALALTAFACAYAAPPPTIPTSTESTPASAHSVAASASTSQAKVTTAELGKVNVKATRQLVQTLQQVKVALKRPFDPSRNLEDAMVCRLWHGRMSGALECGTEGWFTRRRDDAQRAWRGMGPAPVIGHPWHSMHPLNYRQMMVFRKLLKEFPPPGSVVQIVDANGNVLMTIQTASEPAEP